MNTRKIREDLGRVKASCMRRDFERALFLTISALRELGGQTAPSDLRGDFRTAVSYLVADPEYKARIGEAGGASAGRPLCWPRVVRAATSRGRKANCLPL